MSATPLATMLGRFQRLVSAVKAEDLADAELLKRFIEQRDQDAFAALVWRHGPLVWRVGKRVLRNNDGAEDVFQATFLVLARNAQSIRKPAALASWLHGVALRTAREWQTRRACRGHKAQALVNVDPPVNLDPGQQAALREAGRIVEEEVARLAEHLRLPILACYWEGKTNDEAARALGVPAGTVKTRLAKARSVLESRLARRGVTLPGGVVALLLCEPAGQAAVPALLVGTTAKSIAGGSGGGGTVSASVAALAEQASKGLTAASWKPAAFLIVALGAAALGGAGLQLPSAEKKADSKTEAKAAPAKTATAQSGTITGIVVDEAKQPASGVEVALAGSSNPARTVTDDAGRFELKPATPPKFGFNLLAHTKDKTRMGYLPVAPEDRQSWHDLRLTLKAARKVNIVVADPKGKPLAGARAGILSQMARVDGGVTDGQGRVTLATPTDMPVDHLFAWRSGSGLDYRSFGKGRRQGEPAPTLPKGPVELRLTGARTLRITATDADGKPLAGVPFYPWYFEKPGEANDMNVSDATAEFGAITDERGVAVFDWLPAWQDHPMTFWPRTKDYVHRRLIWDPKQGETITMRLERFELLRGQVTHPSGAPAPGITVQAVGDGYDYDDFRGSAKTDADGKYELKVAPHLMYLVVVMDKNFAAEPQTGFAVFPGKPPPAKDFVLRPATAVQGRLTIGKADGKDNPPYAGQTMTLHQKGSDNLMLPDLLPNPEKSRSAVQPTIYHHATTDAQGRFVFHVGPGRYYLGGPGQVKGVGFTIANEPQVEFNFNAPRVEEGRVAGLVVTGNPPAPVADALIDGVYKAWSGRVDPQAKTDKLGRFTMERQRHPLVLHARSGDGKLAGIIEIGPDDATAIIPVDRIATARGRLVAADTGAPMAGRELWYGVRIPIGEGPNTAFSTSFGGKVITDAEGRFELKRLTAGREYRVSLTAEDGQGWRELHKFTPTPGASVDLKDLRVQPPRRPPNPAERKQTSSASDPEFGPSRLEFRHPLARDLGVMQAQRL